MFVVVSSLFLCFRFVVLWLCGLFCVFVLCFCFAFSLCVFVVWLCVVCSFDVIEGQVFTIQGLPVWSVGLSHNLPNTQY